MSQLTRDAERQFLAELGKQLGKKSWRGLPRSSNQILLWVGIVNWLPKSFYGSKSRKSRGQPRANKKIDEWLIKMAKGNRSRGYDRMVGSPSGLGWQIRNQAVLAKMPCIILG